MGFPGLLDTGALGLDTGVSVYVQTGIRLKISQIVL